MVLLGLLRQRWLAALLVSGVLAGTAPGYAATIIDNGQTVNVPTDQTPPWTIPDVLIIGNAGDGTLNIADGVVTSSGGTIANLAGSRGMVAISGTGAWTSGSDITVGNYGAGTLTIGNGGTVVSKKGVIGSYSIGVVNVENSGSSWTITTDGLYVGSYNNGAGTLNITGGGRVSVAAATNAFSVGDFAGSTGTVNVEGEGSILSSGGPGAFVVGGLSGTGTGTLNILSGGRVSADNAGAYIGLMPGSTGMVTVSGRGSTWDYAYTGAGGNFLWVGAGGSGTLTISDGGQVTSTTATVYMGGMQSGLAGVGVINIGAAAGKTPAAPGTLTTPIVSMTSSVGSGSAFLVFNHTDTSGNYEFAPVIIGGSTATSSVDAYAGTTVMTGVGSSYFGPTTIYKGAVLAAGAAGVFSPNSDYTVQSGATMDLRGNSQTVLSAANAGVINMGTGTAPGTTLTVGSYVGNGGTIVLNTHLAGDGSPSDRLVINGGTATGTGTFLQVNNAGGLGALTTGSGILVVEVQGGATTQPGLFTLAAPVAAGAYEYSLYRGGMNGAVPDDWYLRSTIQAGPPVVVPPAVVPPVNPGEPGEPGTPEAPIVIPGPTLPNYRVEVPVYMAAPALANRMGLMMLGTYHERVGEDRSNGTDEQSKHSGWGRVFGQVGSVGFDKSGRNFASNGPSYDFDMGAIQAGADVIRKQHDNGSRDIAGLYVGMMTGHADVKKVYSGGKAGTVDMNGYSLAAYWTHKGAKDWYLDAVLQGTRYADAQAKSERGQKIRPDGWGLAASLEAGYPIALGDKGWALEPQAQVIYQWISLNNDSDAYGRVKFDDSHAWYGRLGARLTKDWTTGKGKKASVWARANLWHSFDSQAKTTFNSFDGQNPVGMKTKLGGTWGQVGLGVSGQLTPRLTAFANGDYNVNLGSQSGHSFGGRLGLRYEF